MSQPASYEVITSGERAIFSEFKFKNRRFYLLRDELIDAEFNGNKARKLYYLKNTNLNGVKRLISHGSSQSNAMYSISVFAKNRGLEFDYFISHMGKKLNSNPTGNLKYALENGMKLYVLNHNENRQEIALAYANKFNQNDVLFIPEGVACKLAEPGFSLQARQIDDFCRMLDITPDVFLPSGTGASAAYLAKASNLMVYTCACVGDSEYLQSQITSLLGEMPKNLNILTPPKKYHFAKPKPELYAIWKELNEAGVEFDLIYDPVGFLTIFANLDKFKGDILYIHQGGLIGNISQKARYERKEKIENLKNKRS